jgi:hypothetical protein
MSSSRFVCLLSAADALSSDGILLSWRKEGEDYSTDEEGSDMEEEAAAAADGGSGRAAGQAGAAPGDVLVSRDDLLNAARWVNAAALDQQQRSRAGRQCWAHLCSGYEGWFA